MGELITTAADALSTAREFKQDLNSMGFGGGGGNYDPGVSLPAPDQGNPAGYGQQISAPQAPQPMGITMLMPTTDEQPMPVATAPEDQPKPFDNPYAKTDQPIEDQITITGDDWAPHKQGTVGKILDTLLMLRGRPPAFKERNDERNLKSAMQGFQKDPETAIDRVRQVDPNAAQQLQEAQSRVQANEELAKQRELTRRIEGGKMMGSMMDAITDDNTYQRVRPMLNKMSDYFGYDSTLLPEKYDREGFDAMVRQGMTPYEGRRLRQFEKAQTFEEGYKNRSLQSLNQHRAATLAEQAEHNDANEKIAQQNANQGNKSTYVLDTKYGPGEVSADRTSMTIVDDQGLRHIYKNMGSDGKGHIRWQLYNSEKPKVEE